jgi:hypothetical protein
MRRNSERRPSSSSDEFPDSGRSEVQGIAKAYVETTVNEEWPLLASGSSVSRQRIKPTRAIASLPVASQAHQCGRGAPDHDTVRKPDHPTSLTPLRSQPGLVHMHSLRERALESIEDLPDRP